MQPPAFHGRKSMPLYDSHMHTVLCHHAKGEASEYAAKAYERSLTGIIFTCHNPLPRGLAKASRMRPEQFDQYLGLVEETRRDWHGRLDVRLGLECDYLPHENLRSWLTQQAAAASFDYLLVSIHPHIAEYRDQFWRGDPLAYQQLYFEHLAEAAELRLHDALAHPDLVKNVTAQSWQVDRIMPDICRCLDRVAATGVAMELNTSGWNKKVPEQNPGNAILCEMAGRQIPIVLGSDAHEPSRVGDRFTESLDLLEEAGFDHVSFFLQRQRQDVSIAEVRTQLTRPAGKPLDVPSNPI